MSSRAERRAERDMLVERQGGLCYYCDAPMTLLRGPRLSTVDHVIPGRGDLVAACHQCNRMKGCLSLDQIRKLADRLEVAILALSDGEARG